MDTFTHALSGALLARTSGASDPGPGQLPTGVPILVGFLAAAAPDLDCVLNLSDPLVCLNWHRGYTHSLLLLPLWAALLALLFRWLWHGRWPWRAFFWMCAASLAIHIAGFDGG
jgi:inner membrane protein